MDEDKGIHLNLDGFDDESMKEFKRAAREAEEQAFNARKNMMAKADTDLKLFMFRVGDFDPRHYTVKTLSETNDVGEGKFRFDLYVRYEYSGTEKERKKAVNILKKMYGKKFKEMVLNLHPDVNLIMSDDEFGNMINDDDIVREFKCRRL